MNNKPEKSGPLYSQYCLEKRLAHMIMTAGTRDRRGLYSKIYDQFFSELDPERKEISRNIPSRRLTDLKEKILKPLLPETPNLFVEIGSGATDVCIRFSRYFKDVISIEASIEGTINVAWPSNMDQYIHDTPPYDLENDQVDLAFSSHFIEHLHPLDAQTHFEEMYRVLRPGGRYLCITPNILYGPHDISQFFGHKRAVGLHLKEYSYRSLKRLASDAGFKEIKAIKNPGTIPSKINLWIFITMELSSSLFPSKWRDYINRRFFPKNSRPFRPLEQVKLVVCK